MSKARNLSDFISDATIDSTEIADLSVTHAKLHTDMNLSSKTLTFAANQISGNSVDGGVISNFASTGIDDNASATAVTILSDGNVGIGTTSPSNYHSSLNNLVIASSGDSGITIASGTSSEGSVAFADGTSGPDAYRGWINYNHNSNFMRFFTNATEVMRISSLGTVLVGKTSEGTDTDGIELNRNDVIVATRNNDAPLILNRRTSDGDITVFRKDNAAVGSIGTASNFMTIGSGDVGLRFHATNNVIFPHDMSANNTPNGTIALGTTGSRFSSLWLSGTGNAAHFTANGGGSAGIDTRLVAANTGNGGTNRGVAIGLYPSGLSNSVEAVKLIGYQNTAASTANNAAFAIQVANTSGTLTERMRIDSSGNVSINSTAPDLVGNTTTLTIGNSSGGGDGMLSLQSGWGNTTYGRMFVSSGVFKIGNPQSNKLVLYTANLDRLRIDENGRAGWSPDGGSNFYIIHGKDGSSSGNAALSAEEIKRTLGSRAVSGYYWLITPSDGVARQWWCDMETDGGGWILVGHHGDGQLATNPGNWFDSTNAGSFNAHSTGTFKGGGYWRTWGAEHVMIECRTNDNFLNNSAVSKVGFKWGSSNNLPSSAAAFNLPTKTFKDWCWDIYNAPGFDPANYQNGIRDSSVNGNASFTEHFVFSWTPRTTGSPGDDGSNGPYWQIGSHHDGIHQHYEESAGGNGVYGNGGFHVVSNEDTTWGGGGNRYGMQRLFRYNDDSGTVNIWIR